ncbi:unnamed protein product [Brassica napus]|uniref:(rape) hypothetical protein n=1 Tax=Brassica napus TaxID=3708 RepID=A0A817B4B1_BRANA|nr:unnamed protein product [Brassica napus]
MSRRRSRHGKEKDDETVERRVAMAMRWSRRGKEIAERENGGGGGCKRLLIERLFATDRFPNKRVNTTDYLSRVRNALNDTLEMAKLIGSCFGGLFKLPAQRKPLQFLLVFGEVMVCRAGSLKMVIASIFTYPLRMKTMSIRID